jgi:hypothetical protein
MYSPGGEHLGFWGEPGSGPGQFSDVRDIETMTVGGE